MADRLVRRAIAVSPRAPTLAVAVLLASSPRARRAARWILLASSPKMPSPKVRRLPGIGRATRADMPAGGQSVARKVLLAVGAAGLTAFAVREYPAVRREVRIWLM
jgi:hypothetical protein